MPARIIVAYRRTSLSSIVATFTEPFCTAVFSASPKNFAVGNSASSPLLADATVLCTAPKSENTNPSKPHSFFRIWFSSNEFSQLKVPLIFGYAHITEPACPSLTAASNAGR